MANKMRKPNILAIIPARGGSKGIPRKNIKKLKGKPLLYYTIKEAKNSKLINKIVLSTDNHKIADIGKMSGVEVPFIRPKKISRPTSPSIDYVKHTLQFLFVNQHYTPNIIVILQPTSPIRTKGMIDKSIKLLIQSKATSVITIKKIRTHPYSAFWLDKTYLRPFKPEFQKYYQRQKYPPLYYLTGSVYTFWYKTFEEYGSIYGPRIKPMIIEDENNIDIDELFDLFVAEMTMKYWKKYKKIGR